MSEITTIYSSLVVLVMVVGKDFKLKVHKVHTLAKKQPVY
jgi:hypothetical protein